jgi:hypothetical protein
MAMSCLTTDRAQEWRISPLLWRGSPLLGRQLATPGHRAQNRTLANQPKNKTKTQPALKLLRATPGPVGRTVLARGALDQ